MDQAHDIAHYLDQGLKEFAGHRGGVEHIVEPDRNIAAISGWGKDEPFTALIFIGFPTKVDRSIEGLKNMRDLLVQLEEEWYG